MTTQNPSLLRKVLFPASSPDRERPKPDLIPGNTVFFRVRLARNTSAEAVSAALNDVLTLNVRTALKATQIYLYSDATHRGIEVVPFNLLRTHRAVSFVTKTAGTPVPPAFTAPIFSPSSTLIEFQFDGVLAAPQRAALAKVEKALTPLSRDVSSIHCDNRYEILDSRITRKDAVFLTVMTRVPWNRSAAEAQAYWKEDHAALVYDNRTRTNMVGYVQVHTTQDAKSAFDNDFNGVATIEYDSITGYLHQLLRPTSLMFNNTLVLDEVNLTVNSEVYLFKRSDLS